MADYPGADETFTASDAKVELAQALYLRFQPLDGTPAETYAIKTRKLPATTVSACADLLYLSSPIAGRPPQDHALVSLLRDDAGEPCGFQLEFCDVAGARTDTEPNKQSYALREHGVRDGLFRAGGEGDTAYLTEGYSCKAIAVASLGLGPAYGGGGLNVLGFAIPAEQTVVIVPDRKPALDQWTADGKQRKADLHDKAYARAIDRMMGRGRTVKMASELDCTVHASCKDADAYLPQHGAIRLKDLLLRTTEGKLSRSGEIKRLAAIADKADRLAEIKTASKGREVLHGIPIKDLRELVEAERKRAQARTATPETEGAAPWEEPILDLASVLDELVTEFGKYIATSPANLDTAALWAAMSHVFLLLECMPKLALQSPTKQCGKTTFLDCLSNVVRRPELVSGVTESAFIRVSDAWQPTWLMDEADRYLDPKTAGEGLTAAMNASSYRRAARKKISVPSDSGGWDIQDFEFWCPMILAGIKALVDTVQDRSIVLVMQRAKPGELKHRLVNGTSPTFEEIGRKLVRWAKDLPALDLDPKVPKWLHNREADLWRPLFAIATLAGGDWPARVEKAAKEIHGQRAEDEVRLALLLTAIREVFGTEERVYTENLISALILRGETESEPWATIKRNGAPIDAYYLRGMLKGVVKREPDQREGGAGHGRHFYTRANFEQAWARYIPVDPSNDPEHPDHPEQRPETPGAGPVSAAPDQGISSGAEQAVDLPGENDVAPDAPDGPDQNRPDANTYAGNGAAVPDGEADRVVDEVIAGARCGYCAGKMDGSAGVVHGGKTFHLDACLAEHLRKQGARA
jgi:Protein of unknown function (DUF3631)